MSRGINQKNNKQEQKKWLINCILFLLIAILFVITATGTYAYFTDGEKIFPPKVGETPKYDQFQIKYSDHSENRTLDEGTTVYFDVSSILVSTGNKDWSAPTLYYYITGSRTYNNGWAYDTSKRMRLDTIRTVTLPTDSSKVSATENNITTGVPYSISPSSITWSGCWVKLYFPTTSSFSIVSSENRYIVVHVGDNQSSNNIAISLGVKEVYIKNATVSSAAGGSDKYAFDKLEIKY